jgi:hypothetical protein
MSYVPGLEISRFIREYKPSPSVVAFLYSELFTILRKRVHRHRRRVPRWSTLESSYFAKIERRLTLSHRTAPRTFSASFLNSEYIYINGVKFRNVPRLLRLLRANMHFQGVLEPRFHSLVVGDTNTENVKVGNIAPLLAAGDFIDFDNPPLCADDLDIRFLDPRAIGFHENGVDTGSDDSMYDNKPWHNSIGNYDLIHGEHFNLSMDLRSLAPSMVIEFHGDSPYTYSYQGIESYFSRAMTRAWGVGDSHSPFLRDDPYWLIRFVFVMGTHFMAMPPFHFSRNERGETVDDPQHQRRPLAVYAEGIKWLNLAVDMLQGRVKEYLGFPVPNI